MEWGVKMEWVKRIELDEDVRKELDGKEPPRFMMEFLYWADFDDAFVEKICYMLRGRDELWNG